MVGSRIIYVTRNNLQSDLISHHKYNDAVNFAKSRLTVKCSYETSYIVTQCSTHTTSPKSQRHQLVHFVSRFIVILMQKFNSFELAPGNDAVCLIEILFNNGVDCCTTTTIFIEMKMTVSKWLISIIFIIKK